MPACCTLSTKPRFQIFERFVQEPTPLPVYQKELEGLVTLLDPSSVEAGNSIVEMSGKGNLCPISQRKANKALRSSFDPTHNSDFGHRVSNLIHRDVDLLSRALLTMIFQRKIKAKKQQNTFFKLGNPLNSKQE